MFAFVKTKLEVLLDFLLYIDRYCFVLLSNALFEGLNGFQKIGHKHFWFKVHPYKNNYMPLNQEFEGPMGYSCFVKWHVSKTKHLQYSTKFLQCDLSSRFSEKFSFIHWKMGKLWCKYFTNRCNLSLKIKGHHIFTVIMEKSSLIIPFAKIEQHTVSFWD